MRVLSTSNQAAGLSLSRRAWLQQLMPAVPGLALSAAIAVASFGIGGLAPIRALGVGPMIIAMVVGMAVANTVYGKRVGACMPGVSFAKQKLLRVGIVLYGMRVTFQDFGQVGLSGIAAGALMVMTTFFLALLVGRFVLKLDRNTVLLIGAGSSICGAAAVLATDPVIKGRAEQVTVAVSTVVIFGTLATILYPVLYQLNAYWPVLPASAGAFGIYIGSTIHEVAQVVAAARSVDVAAVDTAVIVKMVRVMMLSPFLIAIALYIAIEESRGGGAADMPAGRLDAAALGRAVPWFALGFMAAVALNSSLSLPREIHAGIESACTLLLVMAMAALGLTTHLSAIRLAGMKPILLAAVLFAWLVLGGAWINRFVPAVLPS